MTDSYKKLAVYLPTLVSGGAERVFLNLADGFARRGYQVDFVLAQREGSFKNQVPGTVRLVELNHTHLKAGRSIVSLPALASYLRKERPIALFTGLHANIFAVLAKKLAGVPTRLLISEHNTLSKRVQLLPFGYRPVMLWLIKKTYPQADVIAAVSTGVADDLNIFGQVPRERIQVLHNPIITPELVSKVGEDLEHPWFQPGQPPVLLSVGRLNPQKDYPLLLRAFARVRQSLPARLMILGEGPEREALAALAKELGVAEHFSMPGFVPNPYPYMKRAAAFVLSSQWEGLPTVLVEALFCGTPIVATDCPSGSREILHDGAYGKLVPVGDLDCISQAIYETLQGDVIHPPVESWKPYEMETIVSRYLRAIGCEDAA